MPIRGTIQKKISDMINSIECDLHNLKTDLKYQILIPDNSESTLWTQFFSLTIMFEQAYKNFKK